MKQMKYWVIFYTPGSFVADTWTKDYAKLPQPHEVEIPENAYAFQIYQRTDIVEDGKTYKGDAEQIGKTYYHPDSLVTNLEQTKNHKNASEILIRNMECNKWESVVWTRWGNWPQPYDDKKMEVIVPEHV